MSTVATRRKREYERGHLRTLRRHGLSFVDGHVAFRSSFLLLLASGSLIAGLRQLVARDIVLLAGVGLPLSAVLCFL